MSTYALVPGADGRAWYWHLVVPELRRRGHDVVAVDLPADASAGLAEHADAVVRAIGDEAEARAGLVLVAQSLAGFFAPLVCARVPLDQLILVNAMVPAPGETAGEWWAATGQAEARAAFAAQQGRDPEAPFDLLTDFFHDVPADVTAEALSQGEAGPSEALFAEPWPLREWPDVPTRFLQGREDRFFPLAFQRRVVGERLGVPVEDMPGGHLLALSRPVELAELLCREAPPPRSPTHRA
ncbi:alpha/beta fold hydrolase [Streptomyces roseoverticillatus]|uniref:Alpha/beta hydrolase n=1 Tax=Streptomyces roseoverticillatus TaxID=66429 RepID=A0ABV3J9C4_9ACTN